MKEYNYQTDEQPTSKVKKIWKNMKINPSESRVAT